jgi:3-dehydroquinate dehydratase-2
MATAVLVLHGPNLNLLGLREPEVYGRVTLEEIDHRLKTLGEELGLEVRSLQSNHEGGLVDALHDARGWAAGVVLNAAAYTHTSVACATPSPRWNCRWWRCTFPTSTGARNSATAR